MIPLFAAAPCFEQDDLAQGIIEQVGVGQVMDIGFDNKGVTAHD